ncbi:MAG: methionyl-tRNA formyltransferase [Acidobacteria bacterium]|nr:methionyl-tRNA formyltransferase [Acidobacteriota bacterium]
MVVVFLGTPQFAVPTLEAMVAHGHDVRRVYTQPDRPRGRGQELAFSPVKECAVRLGLTVAQPERVRRPEAIAELASLGAAAMVVVGYGQILPQAVIDLAPKGIVNVHASLLPKYRGAAPIQWALANGESVTGVTTMRINAGLDTGDMLLKAETPIGGDEDAAGLSVRLAAMGAELLIETLRRIEAGTLEPIPQDDAEATLAPILTKEDGRIEWTRNATETRNRLRGFQPWPGAYTTFRGAGLKVLSASVAEDAGLRPGQLRMEKRRLLAGCGEGTTLELLEVQPDGRKRTSGESFANGARLSDNELLGT